jgi:RNA polymerase sigma factor (sigma-70 family)
MIRSCVPCFSFLFFPVQTCMKENEKGVNFPVLCINIRFPHTAVESFFHSAAIKPFKVVYNIMEKELQKKSLDRFFRSEYQKLLNFVRKNLEERYFEASPEDIVQDVALGLIDKLDLDTQIGNLTAYIYRSVKNKIIDYRKKKQRNVSIETFTDRKNGNYLLNNVSDEISDEEKDYSDIGPELLQRAISQLRPDEQAVIIANEFEQRSFEDLSLEWDVPLGTLLSRKHRALAKLYRILLTIKNESHGNNRE